MSHYGLIETVILPKTVRVRAGYRTLIATFVTTCNNNDDERAQVMNAIHQIVAAGPNIEIPDCLEMDHLRSTGDLFFDEKERQVKLRKKGLRREQVMIFQKEIQSHARRHKWRVATAP